MKRLRAPMLAWALLAAAAAAPAGTGRPEPTVPRCQAETTGRLVGGIAGALIGRNLGDDGASRAIGTVGGAVIGSVIGGEIGRRIDADDPACRLPRPPPERGRTGASAHGFN